MLYTWGFFSTVPKIMWEEKPDTPARLKYSTFLYLKMNTTQIAPALHMGRRPLRMLICHLKQKFGLRKEDDQKK